MRQPNHAFHPSILREYDIRGRVGETLGNDDAYALGRAFGTYIIRNHNAKTVAIGYDGRISAPGLAAHLVKGLTETGLNCTHIGLGPSPMLYFAVQHLGDDAGIMVTGSHNPPQDNGFKMSLKNASIYGDMIQEIGRIAATGDFETGTGTIQKTDVQSDYVARLLQDLEPGRPLKIAWDNGNGAAGDVLQDLVSHLPGEHILLYDDIDGTFPNHHPDPTVDDNLQDLIATVKREHCDIGIAFDGDGDRIGVVDENGAIIRCDTLLSLYARDVLKHHANAPIIGDVKCSDLVFNDIRNAGGDPVMCKTGHSLVKTKMKETGAPLAGELSGHIFFADRYYGYDDALYCAVRLMNIVSHTDKPLSALLSHLPKTVSTPEIRLTVPEEDKFQIMRDLQNLVCETEGERANTLDGVRVSTDGGWWIIRASNTQNALSIRAEAMSDDGLNAMKNDVNGYLRQVGCGDVAF